MVARGLAPALAMALLSSAPASAAPPRHRVHPEYAARIAAVKTVAVVPPNVDAFEVTANGTAVPRPDWVDGIRENVAAGLEAALRKRGFWVRRIPPAALDSNAELREVRLLYGAVSSAVVQATYANEFPWKLDRFEYALGDLGPLLAAQKADALVFATGLAMSSSRGRIAASLLLAGGASPPDALFVGIVDRTGALLWFGEYDSADSDLRDPDRAARLVEWVLAYMRPVQR